MDLPTGTQNDKLLANISPKNNGKDRLGIILATGPSPPDEPSGRTSHIAGETSKDGGGPVQHHHHQSSSIPSEAVAAVPPPPVAFHWNTPTISEMATAPTLAGNPSNRRPSLSPAYDQVRVVISIYFVNKCPLETFFRKLGISHLVPFLCSQYYCFLCLYLYYPIPTFEGCILIARGGDAS